MNGEPANGLPAAGEGGPANGGGGSARPPRNLVRQPYGVCIVSDREGTQAFVHVSRELCEAGFASTAAPLPTFRCEPPPPLSPDELMLRTGRGDALREANLCVIRPGTWLPDAVVTLHESAGPDSDPAAAPPAICYAVTRPEALAGLEFAVPWVRMCEPDELAGAAN